MRYLDTCRGCGKPRNPETTGSFVNYRGERVLRSRCLECTAAYKRQWLRKTLTYESIKAKSREDYAKRKAADPELNRWRDLRRKYGLSKSDYESMLADQGGSCAACGSVWTEFQVDHCHRTGKIRGLLCSRCNRVLGVVDDNIDQLESLIAYLRRSSDGDHVGA